MPANAFITNSKSRTLKKRLDELIQHSHELKFLVGYFYFSGWRELYEVKKNELTIKFWLGWVQRPRPHLPNRQTVCIDIHTGRRADINVKHIFAYG